MLWSLREFSDTSGPSLAHGSLCHSYSDDVTIQIHAPNQILWCIFLFSGKEFEGEEEYLEILGITREQSGKYECKAANEVSSADVKQVRVIVNCEYIATMLGAGEGGSEQMMAGGGGEVVISDWK